MTRTTYAFPHSDHLSPSQITEYLGCPLCFRLNRIDRIPRPTSIALPIGGAVHKAIEVYRRDRLDPQGAKFPPLQGAVIEEAAAHFDEAVTGQEDLDLGDYADAGQAKDHMVKLVEFALPHVAKLDTERGLVAAELDLKDFESPWPFPMHGRVDALYSDNGEFYSAGSDTKTSSKQQAPDFMAALQIGIYRSFIPGTWFADVLAKTKTPSFQCYTLDAVGDDFVRDVVLDVADRICRGDFPARPGWRCKYKHGNPVFRMAVSWPEVA